MVDSYVIHVSRDTPFLTVDQVPKLIADALHPALPEIQRLAEQEQHEIYLKRHIRNGALKTYTPSMTPCAPADATAALSRILLGDLIRYLASNVPTVTITFHTVPPANADAVEDVVVATSGSAEQVRQEDLIIRTVRSLGFDPLALPAADRKTNSDVKSKVRDRCGKNYGVSMRPAIFKQAWERMLKKRSLRFAT